MENAISYIKVFNKILISNILLTSLAAPPSNSNLILLLFSFLEKGLMNLANDSVYVS